MGDDLLTIVFYQQTLTGYLPACLGIGLGFFIFGNKMINVVIFGCFLWVLLKCYPNIIKAELLNDVKEIWGGKSYKFFMDFFFLLIRVEKSV